MKRILLLILAILLAVVLVGCSSEPVSPEEARIAEVGAPANFKLICVDSIEGVKDDVKYYVDESSDVIYMAQGIHTGYPLGSYRVTSWVVLVNTDGTPKLYSEVYGEK